MKSWKENFGCLDNVEGVGNIAATNHDLSLGVWVVEVNGEEGGHAGGGVVAAATG